MGFLKERESDWVREGWVVTKISEKGWREEYDEVLIRGRKDEVSMIITLNKWDHLVMQFNIIYFINSLVYMSHWSTTWKIPSVNGDCQKINAALGCKFIFKMVVSPRLLYFTRLHGLVLVRRTNEQRKWSRRQRVSWSKLLQRALFIQMSALVSQAISVMKIMCRRHVALQHVGLDVIALETANLRTWRASLASGLRGWVFSHIVNEGSMSEVESKLASSASVLLKPSWK